jgi:hypothetical protein
MKKFLIILLLFACNQSYYDCLRFEIVNYKNIPKSTSYYQITIKDINDNVKFDKTGSSSDTITFCDIDKHDKIIIDLSNLNENTASSIKCFNNAEMLFQINVESIQNKIIEYSL